MLYNLIELDQESSPDEDTPKQYDDYLAVLDDISAQTAAIAIDENMFDNFLACIADRFEIDQCGLLLFDPDDGQFKCLSRIGYDEETEDKLVFDLNYNDIYANLANKKSYIVHRDEPQFGGLADIMSEKDYAEAEFQLWLPFVFSSRIIGIMLVTHSMSAVTDDYIRALEVAGRLNGATLYNLYQQYTVLCEEYEDEDENLDAEQLAEENEQLETDISTPFNDHASEEDSSFTESVEVNENEEKSDEVPADTEEIIEDDDAEFSEEEFAAELMSEWDNAGENEESSEESSIDNSECIMHNDEDNNEADTSENEADTSDEEITPSTEPVEVAEDDSIIIEETPIEEEIIEESESTMDQAPLTEENEDETPIEDTDSFDEQGRTDESIDNSSPDELAEAELAIEAAITDDVIEAEYTIPSDNEMASEIDSIIIDESSFGEENETEQSAECEVQDDDSSNVIPTEANEVSEAEKSDEVNDDENSIIIEET
ncbi:MAG: hypothetical protein J6W76_07670, partial [Spirochaetales bacterium]|nr:hypothetical protein [Spirochaetales bacterium]